MTLTSVGVATPKRSVPMMKIGISSAGKAKMIWLLKARNPPGKGAAGRPRRLATYQTIVIMPAASRRPGRIPATNRSTIETFATNP